MQPFGTIYDPTWDLRAYTGWSPSMKVSMHLFSGLVPAFARLWCSIMQAALRTSHHLSWQVPRACGHCVSASSSLSHGCQPGAA